MVNERLGKRVPLDSPSKVILLIMANYSYERLFVTNICLSPRK